MADRNGRPGELIVTPISSITRQAVNWLWPGRLAIGKLTLLDGDPGAGKSWLSLAIGTAVAHGAPFPIDSEARQPARVLLMTAEDGLADTVAPRLDAMGADTHRIEAVEATACRRARDPGLSEQEIEERRPVWLTEDLGAMERVLQGRLYKLLIIDPLNAYIPAEIDSAKDNAVRSVLAPLTAIADRCGVAVLAIRHLTKGSRDRAIYRGQGSIGYTAAARIVLLAGQETNNGGRRLVMPIKCNLAPLAAPVSYAIEGGRFVWGEAAPGIRPEAVLAADPGLEERTGTHEAEEMLAAVLSEGDLPAGEASKRVREALRCSQRTVERAKFNLHIRHQRRGFGRQSEVYWHLPHPFSSENGAEAGAGELPYSPTETGSPARPGAHAGGYPPGGEYGGALNTATNSTAYSPGSGEYGALPPPILANTKASMEPSPAEIAAAAALEGPPEDLSELADADHPFTED